jgi:hypothetical protein
MWLNESRVVGVCRWEEALVARDGCAFVARRLAALRFHRLGCTLNAEGHVFSVARVLKRALPPARV